MKVPARLRLSTRCGPQTELYDVADAHLLSSFHDASNVLLTSTHSALFHRNCPFLAGCWVSTGVNVNNENRAVQVAMADSSPLSNDFTIGRLPTKDNGAVHSNRIPLCLGADPYSAPESGSSGCCTSCFHYFRRCLSCFSLCDFHVEKYAPVICQGYYKHIFTLYYRKHELCTFFVLALLMAVVQAGISFLTISDNSRSTNLQPTYANWCRIAILSACALLSAIGLGFLNSKCSWHFTSHHSDSTKNTEYSNQIGKHVTYLISVRRFQRLLRRMHILGYVSCVLLCVSCLPWSTLFESDHRNILPMSDKTLRHVCVYTSTGGNGDFGNHNAVPRVISGSPDRLSASSANPWTVLWLVVAVHGSFDLEGFFASHWRYAITVCLCLGHIVLVNLVSHFTHLQQVAWKTTGTTCLPLNSSVSSVFVLQSISVWDSHVMLIFRTNVVLLIAFVAAHLIGRSVAAWTVRHRYHLFLATLRGQTKLDRLYMIKTKLNELASVMVPTPLAAELAHDFVAGYLAWRSPLVIYLRNISFLSAELIGLSHLASCISQSPSSVLLTKQFVTFMNGLAGCFDQLAKREGCYRVRLTSSEYLCIAGYPESRVDHARSCVELGLNILNIVGELSEIANLHLLIKVAVHTGTAYAAVIGRTRLGFDVTGEDVQFTNWLRQSASRQSRVLVSQTTFSQLPEGFRGEAGPIFDYPHPSSEHPTAVSTYFVQPRHGELKSSVTEFCRPPVENVDAVIGRLHLTDLDPANLSALGLLVAGVSAIYRRIENRSHDSSPETCSVDLPLDLFFDADTEHSELLKIVRTGLIDTITCRDCVQQDDDSKEQLSRFDARDPSTSELLAMAAVTIGQPDVGGNDVPSREKLIPCQRRAGRLRNRCSNGGNDYAEPSAHTPVKNTGNSARASLITTPTTTAVCSGTYVHDFLVADTLLSVAGKPAEPVWPLRQCIAPPGFSAPTWFTLDAKAPQCCLGSLRRLLKNESDLNDMAPAPSPAPEKMDEQLDFDLTSTRLTRIWLFHVTILLPMVVSLAFVHLFSVSGSFWLLLGFVGVLLYFALQLITTSLFKRLSWSGPSQLRSIRFISIGSILAITIACLISLSMCRPDIPIHVVVNGSNGSWIDRRVLDHHSLPLGGPICAVRDHFAVLTSLACLLPMLSFQAITFAVSTAHLKLRRSSPASSVCGHYRVFSQSTILVVGVILCAVYSGVYLWLALYLGLDNVPQLSLSNSIAHLHLNFSYIRLVCTLLGLLFFTALSFVLPRTLQYQSVLLGQWLRKNHEASRELKHGWLALIRLLVSVAPPSTVLSVLQQHKAMEVYSKCETVIGLAVIQITASSVDSPPLTTKDETLRDTPDSKPSRIADRLRLINYLIGLIDGLVDCQQDALESDFTSGSKPTEQRNPGLIKVHASGTSVGYAVGCSPADVMNDHARQAAGFTRLLTFAERVVETCEHVNRKTKSTNNSLYVRIALHTGPALFGLIGKHRPSFTVWGDTINVCLYLLQESYVPALYRQHLLLATDEVISLVPISRINASSVAGRPLIWRCVDTLSAVIVPSTSSQARRLSAAACSNRPLHFCSIFSDTHEATTSSNQAASALISLAKRASSRTTTLAVQRSHPLTESCTFLKQPQVPATDPNISVFLTTATITADVAPKLPQYPVPNSLIVHPTAITGESMSITNVQPPPPPPHNRAYPPSNSPDCLSQFVLMPNNVAVPSVTSSSVKHFSAAQSDQTPSRAAMRPHGRREVISQYNFNNHDYSIVNVEPPSPKFNQSVCISKKFQRPQTEYFYQSCLRSSPVLSAEYWPNGKAQQLTNGAQSEKKDDPSESIPSPNEFGYPAEETICIKRSSSSSSTNSFLAAERACNSEFVDHAEWSTEAARQIVHSEDDAISHHNPLYTDNEYDSMSESQTNLAGEHVRQPAVSRHVMSHKQVFENGAPLPPLRAVNSPIHHSRVNELPYSGPAASGYYDVCPNDMGVAANDVFVQRNVVSNCYITFTHSGDVPGNLTNSMGPSTCQPLQFPDIGRSITPVHYEDSVRLLPRTICTASLYANGHSYPDMMTPHMICNTCLSNQPRCASPATHLALSFCSAPTVVASCPDYNSLSFRCSLNPVIGLSKENKPVQMPITQSDCESNDAEYVGTYSLGPLSLTVQPSSAGDDLTSCDEGDGDFVDGSKMNQNQEILNIDKSSVWHSISFHPTPTCMTDSLLANPDLESNLQSELGDDDCQTAGEAELECFIQGDPLDVPVTLPHYACIDRSAAQLGYSAIFRSNQLAVEEIFAYHNSPNFALPFTQPLADLSCETAFTPIYPTSTVSSDRPSQNCLRPTLPDVSPVCLPNFSVHTMSAPLQDGHANSDYDNLCSDLNTSFTGNSPSPIAFMNGVYASKAQLRSGHLSYMDVQENGVKNGSEYDNVDRSTGLSTTTTDTSSCSRPRLSPLGIKPKRCDLRCKSSHSQSDRSSELVGTQSAFVEKRTVFNSAIIAEAQRISQQFHAVDWIPTSGCSRSSLSAPPMERNTTRSTGSLDLVHNRPVPVTSIAGLKIRERSLNVTCFDTFDVDYPDWDVLSSSSSVVSSVDEGEQEFEKTIAEHGDSIPDCRPRADPLRRCKSSRHARQSHQPTSHVCPATSPRFMRLQRRAARVRSLIPPDLQPFILPSCMSSLSRSSSGSCCKYANRDCLFLSTARNRPTSEKVTLSAQPYNRLTRCKSDPMIHFN